MSTQKAFESTHKVFIQSSLDMTSHSKLALLPPKSFTPTRLNPDTTDTYAEKHLRKRSKFESALSNSKKAETQTYNKARLEGVYRTPSYLTASYQPKAMHSTPLNNRKGDKKVVYSVQKVNATSLKKDPFLLGRYNSKYAPASYRQTKNLIQSFNRRSAQSEEKLPESEKADEQAQNQSATRFKNGAEGGEEVRVESADRIANYPSSPKTDQNCALPQNVHSSVDESSPAAKTFNYGGFGQKSAFGQNSNPGAN